MYALRRTQHDFCGILVANTKSVSGDEETSNRDEGKTIPDLERLRG